MKKFIFLILIFQIIGSNIYAQVVEQEYYDLKIPYKVASKKSFVIYQKSDALWVLDCKLSKFDFYKYTIVGMLRSTCGSEGRIALKIFRDDKNRKYIIKSRFQNECSCRKLRQSPEVRIVYTKRLKNNYKIEYKYLKPRS